MSVFGLCHCYCSNCDGDEWCSGKDICLRLCVEPESAVVLAGCVVVGKQKSLRSPQVNHTSSPDLGL